MPKIITQLRDMECKNARPREKPYKLFDGKGLYLEVLPTGRKYWRLKYRIHGIEKRITLGSYPETTLEEVRYKSLQERKRCKDGVDPIEHRRNEREDRKRAHRNTFELLAREWHGKNQARWRSEKYAKHVLRRLEIDVFPTLGHRPMSEIETMEVVSVLRKIQGRGVNELARRLKLTIGQVFAYAFLEGMVKGNPVSDLKCKDILMPYQRGHYTALSSDKLPEFLQNLAANKARLYPHTLLAMELLIHTFVRTNELIGACWEEFNFVGRVWVIPASRMKMGREHAVPLSQQSLDILNELASLRVTRSHDDFPDYVFPSLINPRNPMSNNTILKALERMGYKGKATGHGFRATATTAILENLGYRYDVVDRQLSHGKGGKVRTAYDRAEFWDERVAMMQKWSDYLDRQAGKRPMLLQLRRFQDEQSARMAS